jgi:hypothetical protein
LLAEELVRRQFTFSAPVGYTSVQTIEATLNVGKPNEIRFKLSPITVESLMLIEKMRTDRVLLERK